MQVAAHWRIYLGHLDLTGATREVSFGPLTRAMLPVTTFADGGYTTVIPGLASGEASITGFQDFASGAHGSEISIGQLGTRYPLSVVPAESSTVAAGDVCWLTRGVLDETVPFTGAVGDVAGFADHLTYDTAIPRGLVAHPLGAETADGTGTAVTLAGPSASQSLYAVLHVTAYSGLTNIVVKVQSDDGSGFSSPTDRITFATVTGTTSEFASVAGGFSSETHHRVVWDVTGTGSCSFFAAFGVV